MEQNTRNQIEKMPYLTKQNLSLVLQKEGENLNYWIKRLIKDKEIIPLKKGLGLGYFREVFL